MNSTPNYGFDKTVSICGISEIDREIKRLEDKIDCHKQCVKEIYSKCETDRLLDGKVDKKDGCRLICEEELKSIQKELDCRYTKGEIGNLLDQKVDKATGYIYLDQVPDFFEYDPDFENSNARLLLMGNIVVLTGSFVAKNDIIIPGNSADPGWPRAIGYLNANQTLIPGLSLYHYIEVVTRGNTGTVGLPFFTGFFERPGNPSPVHGYTIHCEFSSWQNTAWIRGLASGQTSPSSDTYAAGTSFQIIDSVSTLSQAQSSRFAEIIASHGVLL